MINEHPGIPPENRNEKIAGLKEAIEATKKRIVDNGSAPDPDLEAHLKSLNEQLEVAQEELQKAA